MINIPSSTEFHKRIPKQKFYENLTISPVLKRAFVNQIKTIYWRNKIAPATVNLAAGGKVTELEVFSIQLNQPSLDEAVLRQIDKQIPYHILFLLEYEDTVQARIGYKEASSGENAFKVDRYYHTDWLTPDKLDLRLEGLTMDAVYESFVCQIAGHTLSDSSETLKESVERSKKKAELEKKIAALQTKIRREKQLNRQMEMNAELKKLKLEIEGII